MKILKLCISEWSNASRDKRELSACREMGAETMVMAKGNPTDRFRKNVVDDFEVVRFSARPLGSKAPITLNRVVSIFTWSHYARQFQPDVISGHDLPGLLIGWISTWFVSKAKKPVLVYDSHEFELGRNAKRSRYQTWFIKQAEGFLIRRCAFSIMVNDAIADEVQRIYHLPERSVVVRSTPSQWVLQDNDIRAVRESFCHVLHVPKDTFLVMYHGAITADRGIEPLIETVARNPQICGVILGNAQVPVYLQKLKELAQQKGVSDRILFHPAVPIDQLRNYVGAADVGLIAIPSVCKSYYYMLPNKFFENIQSLTPVICSDFPAVGSLVKQYQIGLTCDPENLDAIHSCVECLRTDTAFYAQCKKNLLAAKADLCWEKEKEVLKAAYREVGL